ncbi:MAG TPA: PEP-CTERM/exosortase system-associated acyltransferase [Candidatus Acidoferrales bacterium]|nr:PEP-CTERM/exosortase system-associated acyltransferase [Candidatus Acidoferrales bacterium]
MFDKDFEAFLADCDAGKDIHYRLRYQVYCLKMGYEDPRLYPDRKERDQFDDHAVHFIVRKKATGEWIAAMRLIVAPLHALPVSQLTRIDLDRISEASGGIISQPSQWCAEISRLCVVPQYRRRAHERNFPYQVSDGNRVLPVDSVSYERRQAPWIMLGLLRAAREYSLRIGLSYWFFLIADSLARLLQAQGIDLSIVGQACNHRGLRRPHLSNVQIVHPGMRLKSPLAHAMFLHRPCFRLFSELEDDGARLRASAV